jgi:hypothetical protein
VPPTQARFFDLVRLQQQLDADSKMSLRDLRARDNALGQKIQSSQPLARLLACLDALELKQPNALDQPKHIPYPEGLLQFGLCALGFVLGIVSMTGVLFASQQQPVNILIFLGLFVGLQLLLVIFTIGSALLPLKHPSLASPSSLLNPAVWTLKRVLRRFSYAMPWHQVPRLTRLLVLRWGQVLAISFNGALIFSFCAALVVSDRIFAWSSTLNITDSGIFSLLRSLSLPWSWLIDDSVSRELVSGTRFQSLQTQFSIEQVATMRQWWPFLLYALVAYGLLPRVILYLLFNLSFKRQLEKTLLHYPGVNLVLDRLNSPLINTQPATHEEAAVVNNNVDDVSVAVIEGETLLVNWCGASDANFRASLTETGLSPGKTLPAGLNLNDDTRVIGEINRDNPNTLIIAVKSWEPPLAELSDFIGAINNKIQIVLLLVASNEKNISASEWKDWQIFARDKLTRPVYLLKGESRTRLQGELR